MIALLTKAAENFCIHQIRKSHNVSDKKIETRTVVAYIDIDADTGSKHRVFTIYDTDFIQMVAEVFLFEDESDDETLQDMALETANMIIGSAKVLAAESNDTHFNISTPHLEMVDVSTLQYDTSSTISIEDASMMIAIKEL